LLYFCRTNYKITGNYGNSISECLFKSAVIRDRVSRSAGAKNRNLRLCLIFMPKTGKRQGKRENNYISAV
jgi:hypothetical protein